jgi:hypothetical protein
MSLTLQFTQDGEAIGPKIESPDNADDLDVTWAGARGKTVILFTLNGGLLGVPKVSPKDANDIHIVFEGADAGVRWTRDRQPIGPPIPFPEGMNDMHFYIYGEGGWIVSASWSAEGTPIKPPIEVPPGANDFHVKGSI